MSNFEVEKVKFKNFIYDNGKELSLEKGSFLYEYISLLNDQLENFEDYLFIYFGNNNLDLPNSRLFKHPKKVLIWESNENKTHNIEKIEDDYLHIFTNYHWRDDEKVTSLPLGYHTFIDNMNELPMQERLFDAFFIGCLNKNRVQLASKITNIPKSFIWFGLSFLKKATLMVLNIISRFKYPKSIFRFNPDFNAGLKADEYHYYLKHSKVALIPRGWVNTETFRLYEAMRWGCVVICETLSERSYHNNIPAIQVKDWNQGIDEAISILHDEQRLINIGKQNKMFYEKYLSPQATADLITKKLNNTKTDE